MNPAKLTLGGRVFEFPVVVGSEDEVGIDFTTLRSKTGAISLDPGWHEATISNDGCWWLDRVSNLEQPVGLYLRSVDGDMCQPLTENDPEVAESFTPAADSTQGGGDGIIRIGTTYDDNSLISAQLDDQGNVTLYLYDNLNRRVTETKGLTTATGSFLPGGIQGNIARKAVARIRAIQTVSPSALSRMG